MTDKKGISLSDFINTSLIFGMSYSTMEKKQDTFEILKRLYEEVEKE